MQIKVTSAIVAMGISLVLACSSTPRITGNDVVIDDPSGAHKGGKHPETESETDPDKVELASSSGIPETRTTCEPATCESLSYDCGKASDGCGGILECGKCSKGAECGLVERNVCATAKDLCEPQSRKSACAGKQCGLEGDGCGGVYNCGECEDTEACGAQKAFTCGPKSSAQGHGCSTQITSCLDAGAACGKIGDGCGGIVDCDAEVGGCIPGEVCGGGGPNLCGKPAACVPIAADVACAGKCGVVSNGCGEDVNGGLIDCSLLPASRCAEGTSCGAAGVPNQCGSGTGVCEPLAKEVACANHSCGIASDGCDTAYSCGSCDSGELCRQGKCEPLCVPTLKAVACAAKQCGSVSDDCGGLYACGDCESGEVCGLSTPFQCAAVPSGQCLPLTTEVACAGRECGTVYDGCGTAAANIINCGASGGGCPSGQYCGIQQSFQCDFPPVPTCTPAHSCAELGWACGTAFDDCGTPFNCAAEGRACNPQTEICTGGINTPTVCSTGGTGTGVPGCDVCDALPNCPGSTLTRLSGRVITPGRNDADSANQVGVPNAFVYILRSSNEAVLPHIPEGIPSSNGTFGTSCDRCADEDLGPVLASATTGSDGQYLLEGKIPVGKEFLLVVKIGKWRRAERVTLASNAQCVTTPMSPLKTRLPRTHNDGVMANIPHIAVSTGQADAMECVFYKLGLDATEFSQPGGAGDAPARIHMYRSEDKGGATMSDGSTGHSALYSNQVRLFGYDMVVFDCEGGAYEHDSHDPRLREYVNRGGRMFASHWSYTWIRNNGSTAYSAQTPFDTGLGASASWTSGIQDASDTGWVSLGRPGVNTAKLGKFASWLTYTNAASVDGQGRYAISITDPRDLATSVGASSEEFVYRNVGLCNTCASISSQSACGASGNCSWSGNACVAVNNCTTKNQSSCQSNSKCSWKNGTCSYKDSGCAVNKASCATRPQCGWVETGTSVQQFAFNTPYAAPDNQICGRVAYSGFHVAKSGSGDFSTSVFPSHCSGNLSAQEKVLLYMLFDLGSCVTTDIPTAPTCKALTTNDCTNRCGIIANGCGGTIDCSSCPSGQICQSGGICKTPTCTPTTCAAEGATCGSIADGCGGALNCGMCGNGQQCGLLHANQCAPVCTPTAKANACANKCGFVSDGCGGVHQCAGCDGSLSCSANACIPQQCNPATVCPPEAECGQVSDGCSGTLTCGACAAPKTCGGGGQPNKCGAPTCTPLTCNGVGAQCGWIGDGCGGSVNCGGCAMGQVCGAGGPNKCGGCQPLTCAAVGATCGVIGDGCGGTVACGDCTGGKVCGAQQANKCGTGSSCQPLTCMALNAQCGTVGDGCGAAVDCGDCPDGQLCGINTAFQCGTPPACTPFTCAGQHAECGAIGDGCGGLVDCGGCPSGRACGSQTANKCDPVISIN